jgi:hypothetical protein
VASISEGKHRLQSGIRERGDSDDDCDDDK